MTDKTQSKPHVVEITALLFWCFLIFFRLGIGELQSWDEGLYAVRARACLEFNTWLDQTDYAAGELYSSSHPPLGVWLTAASFAAFGINEWSARLPAALAGALLIITLHFFLRKRFSMTAALMGSGSLALAFHFLWYSRHGQLDSLQLLFTGLGFFFFIRLLEHRRSSDVLWCGVFLGLSLLSKFLVSGLAIAAWLPALWIAENRWARKAFPVSLLIAFAVSAPWYIFMAVSHPGFLSHLVGAVQAITLTGYTALPSRAWWYYFNQVLIALPLLPLALVGRTSTGPRKTLWNISLTWFLFVLVVLTLSVTKMPHFTLHLLLPGALLIASSFERVRACSVKSAALLVAAVGITTSWSLSELVRMSVKAMALRPDAVPALLTAVGIISITAVTVAIIVNRKLPAAKAAVPFLSAILVLLSLVTLWKQATRPEAVYTSGAREIRSWPGLSSISHLLIIHRPTRYSRYQPQLAFYLDGWTLGWQKGRTSVSIPWDQPDSIRTFLVSKALPSTRTAVIWSRPWNTLARLNNSEQAQIARLDSLLRRLCIEKLNTRNYRLYTPRDIEEPSSSGQDIQAKRR